MPKPTNEIFKGTLDELMLGVDMKDALGYLARAMPNNMDLRFFITSVVLQREIGGNLARILDVLSETIRERFKLMGKLHAQTAQARLSGIILSIIPPIICAVLLY
jgi:tight adherence protein B